MATHKIGNFKFRLSKEGFAFRMGEGQVHRLPFGRGGKDQQPEENGYYPEDDSDYAYDDQNGYQGQDGYDDGGYYDDREAYPPEENGVPEDYYDGQEGDYYPPEGQGFVGKAMEFIESHPWVVLALLVVFPPLGIYLLWRMGMYNSTTRLIISAVSALWLVLLLVLIFSNAFKGTNDVNNNTPGLVLTTPNFTSAPTAEPSVEPTDAAATVSVNDPLGGETSPSPTPVTGIGGTDTTGEATGDYVYSPQTGLYYHKDPNCSKIDANVSVSLVTIQAAQNRNQSPCPLCCGGTVYYATKDGSHYHTNSTCSGMKNAVEYSKEAAEAEGKTACPICAGGKQTDTTDTSTESKAKQYAMSIKNDKSGIKVYMTSGGKAYHLDKNCQGMSGASEVTLLKALQSGKPACSVCVPALNNKVYCTSSGKYYHSRSACGTMKKGTQVSLAWALVLGKKKCPDCITDDIYKTTPAPTDSGNNGGKGGTSGDVYVYATENGSYYHTNATCGGMKNAQRVLLKTMLSAGRPACPVCASSANTTVYASKDNKYYHSYATCGGMKGAVSGSLAQALANGFTACPNCWGSKKTTPEPTLAPNATPTPTVNPDDGNTGYSGVYVYATETGKNYHVNKDCSELESGSVKVLLEQAIDDGKTPCSKCASYANDKVYAAKGNPYFHKNSSCSGITGAKSGTIAQALIHGFKACPVCFGGAETPLPNTSKFKSGTSGISVYASVQGKYYHMKYGCTNLTGTPIKVTLETALNNGKSACPVCASSAKHTVYGTKNGKYYHYSATCAGSSASSGRLDTALAYGLKPCPNCVTGNGANGDEGVKFKEGTSGIKVYASTGSKYYHVSKDCSKITGDMEYVTLEKALNYGKQACSTCSSTAGKKVYAVLGSKTYHYDADCAGPGATTGTLAEALAYGFKSCSICVTGKQPSDDPTSGEDYDAPADTRVYVDLSGNSSALLYHTDSKCSDSGMSDGTAVTLEYALNHGLHACGYCNPPTSIQGN